MVKKTLHIQLVGFLPGVQDEAAADSQCLSWEDVRLFYSWRTDYFHILNLNAEFKSTANPVNKIPRCKLMNPRIQQRQLYVIVCRAL